MSSSKSENKNKDKVVGKIGSVKEQKELMEEKPTDAEVLKKIQELIKAPTSSLNPEIVDLITECQEMAAESGRLAQKLEGLRAEAKRLEENILGNSLALVKIARIIYKKEAKRNANGDTKKGK